MRVLVVGGSGKVAGLILPTLLQNHTARIFDLRPPADPALEYVAGNVGDLEALTNAAQGMDALLYMAMGFGDWQHKEIVASSFDANVKGVYLALQAAHQAGITHAVYTSSMSVYDGDLSRRYFADEEVPLDSTHFYGFTKRLGEECCQNAVRAWGMTANALRLCLPVPESEWMKKVRAGTPTIMTTGEDVGRAIVAALERRFTGFEAFMISGDYEQKLMNMAKAKRLLDWEPRARPRQ